MVRKRKLSHDGKTEIKQNKGLDSAEDKASTKRQKDSLGASGSKWEKKDAEWIEKFTAYLILFVISLLAVSHILPYGVPFALVFLYLLLRDRKILTQVDYSLLCIFIALFISLLSSFSLFIILDVSIDRTGGGHFGNCKSGNE